MVRTALWAARHNAFWAIKDKWAGKDLIATDIAVPVSKLAELVSLTKNDIKVSRTKIVCKVISNPYTTLLNVHQIVRNLVLPLRLFSDMLEMGAFTYCPCSIPGCVYTLQ